MVRKTIFALVIVIFLATTLGLAAPDLLVDQADILSPEEETQLRAKLEELSKTYDMDVAFIALDNVDGPSRNAMEAYWEENGYGANGSGLLLFVDMTNREIHILTEGEAIGYLDDQRIERLYDVFFAEGLEEGDYFRAASAYLDQASTFFSMGKTGSKIVEEKVRSLSPANIGFAGVVGLLAGGLFYNRNKKKADRKYRPRAFQYRDGAVFNYRTFEDRLLATNVIPRKVQRAVGSSGGGGTTTVRKSSTGSGRTYGGGKGRKF